jgi:hypothetical protein
MTAAAHHDHFGVLGESTPRRWSLFRRKGENK